MSSSLLVDWDSTVVSRCVSLVLCRFWWSVHGQRMWYWGVDGSTVLGHRRTRSGQHRRPPTFDGRTRQRIHVEKTRSWSRTWWDDSRWTRSRVDGRDSSPRPRCVWLLRRRRIRTTSEVRTSASNRRKTRPPPRTTSIHGDAINTRHFNNQQTTKETDRNRGSTGPRMRPPLSFRKSFFLPFPLVDSPVSRRSCQCLLTCCQTFWCNLCSQTTLWNPHWCLM